MNQEEYCFVCGFDLSKDHESKVVKPFSMCPCCGFHYGVEDVGESNSYMEARESWISDGMPFGVHLQPGNMVWSLDVVMLQLENLKRVDTKGTYFSKFKKENPNWTSIYRRSLVVENWTIKRKEE